MILRVGGVDEFTVPADITRNVIEAVHPDPRTLAAVLQAAGLHWSELREPGLLIGQRKELAVLHALTQRLNDTYFAAEIGMKISGRTSTLVSYLMHSSRTLGEAMSCLVRFVPLTRPGGILHYVLKPGSGEWDMDNQDPWVRDSPIYQEFITSMVLSNFRSATGVNLRPLKVELRQTSRGRTARLAHLWGCPVSTDRDRHVVAFSEAALSIPLVDFDAPLLRHLKSYSEMLLENREATEPGLKMQVERSILNHLTRGAPPVSTVADEVGMSVRTLTRRLGEINLSYRGLVEDVRRRKAELMLCDSNLSLAEIAFVLGYSEQSSFTNAFRRWTGQAPGSYRADWRAGLIEGKPARKAL